MASQAYEVVRRISFCAGHRIYGHDSKCANLHGHNYVALFHAAPAAGLDAIGRVIDFSVLKNRLGGWIDEHWDHGMILWDRDEAAIAAARSVAGQKLFLLRNNPTAENLASELLTTVAPAVLSGLDVVVTRVVVWETENCYAEVIAHAGHQPDPSPGARRRAETVGAGAVLHAAG